MRSKFIILLFLLSFTIAIINAKPAVPGFFFSMPKILQSGENETVCLSTHFLLTSNTVRIVVDLKIKDKHFFTVRVIDSEHSCFDMHVPNIIRKEPQIVNVKVQVQINGITYFAHNQDPVTIYSKKQVIFIETDRITYKSEDTVKLRLVSLEENLLPALNYKIPYVRICNPLGVGVMLWKNITTDLGLVQLEYHLPPDSLPGNWKIEAGEETKIFQVDKYVLPRFKVYIMAPKLIYFKIPSLTVKVCAKYSYGAIVKGTAFLRLTDNHHNIKNIQAIKKMTDGCAEFIFSQNALAFDDFDKKYPLPNPRIGVLITATVTEDGTDKIELTTAKSLIILKPYSLKFKKNDYFFSGLPYYGAVQLHNINIDVTGEVIEICYIIAVKKSWNYLNNEHCRNFTLREEKLIQFHILPLKNNIIHFQLNARSLNHSNIGDNLLVVRVYSPSTSYITLDQVVSGEQLNCRAVQQFSVQYTADKLREGENVTFYYMIKTKNQIHKMRKAVHSVQKHYLDYTNEYKDIIGDQHKHIRTDCTVGKFVLKFRLDEKIISNYHLLVYYVTSEGEMISTTKEIEVEPCFNNEIKANWSHKQIVPGGTASLLLETKSDSLCAISAIDKASIFMDGTNTLNIRNILKPFLEEKETPESRRKSCIPPIKRHRHVSSLIEMEHAISDLNRTKRFIYSYSEDYDVYDIFNKFGIITITNFKVVTKPCYTGPQPPATNPVQFLTDQYDIQNEDRAVQIRSFFPETWLWDLVLVRNAAVVHRNLPHAITTWVTNILCVSATDGLGLSKTTEITTFQPFFIEVLTPYSIKVGETLYLNIIVFNYLTYDMPVRISVTSSTGLSLVDVLHRKSFSYCVSSNNTVTHMFELKGMKVEKANVTVLAELDPAYPGQCGPDILINKKDVVVKSLSVEPQGHPVQITKSALLCESGSHSLKNITWKLKVPNDIVSNTFIAEVVLNGDVLGQALHNFDELITMPTGCGEQIMASLAPNIYILKYLNATKSLTSIVKHRVLRNLKIGYQRILNYIHKDGSFSAFGYHDPIGSMFLTAFVVRILQDIKQFIYVDQKVINRAVSWILSHQLENGCFSTMLHVFQDMGGTTFENSTAGLTAYVMISLIDGNIEIPESVQTNAKYCIRGYYHLDKYTLAISSYALLKVNWYSEANRMLTKLFQISNQKNNMMWWSNQGEDMRGSLANDIEITSYVLLALLHQRTQENLGKAHAVVQWLTSQQNPQGGFRSTQDTVVALDALTRYSHLVNHQATNLNIGINTNQRKFTRTFNNEDRLQSKKVILSETDNNITIDVQGSGCVLAQLVQSYYLKHITNSNAFKLNTEILPLSKVDECSIATLLSCFSYTGPDHQSNMAILEVGLPSGYEADRASLYKLIDEDKTTRVKMFEEQQQKIVLYLTKLNSQPVCVNFNINENVIVHSRSNSSVKLYDYYKPEHKVFQLYQINENCRYRSSVMPDLLENSTRETSEKLKNSKT